MPFALSFHRSRGFGSGLAGPFAAVLAGLLASLAGCSHELHVAVSDTRDPHPLIRLGASEEGVAQDVPVNEIRVVPEDDGRWDYGHPAWCVALDPGTYQPIAEVRYGDRPPGFVRCGATAALQPGHRYLVSVSGAGTVAKAEFEAGR